MQTKLAAATALVNAKTAINQAVRRQLGYPDWGTGESVSDCSPQKTYNPTQTAGLAGSPGVGTWAVGGVVIDHVALDIAYRQHAARWPTPGEAVRYAERIPFEYKEDPMPLLQVRDFPQGLYDQLGSLARRERRSVAQQATVLLGDALASSSVAGRRRDQALADAAALRDQTPANGLDPTVLVRQDRQR
jgi:hypothetical protein